MKTDKIDESNNEEIQNGSSLDESGNKSEELDLRGVIEKATSEASKEDSKEAPQEDNSENKKEPETETKAEAQTKAKTESDSEVELPDAWKSRGNREDWEKVPASIKKMIVDREKEVNIGFTKLDEDRNFGKQLKEAISPYEQMIGNEGSTPIKAVQELLKTAYLLRTADPVKKSQLFSRLAQQYEVNLQEVASGIHDIDPVQQLRNEFDQMKRMDQERQISWQQKQDADLQKHIEDFSKNAPHFETLKPMMGTFLSSGQAEDLQTAYDLAFRAHPETSQEWLKQEISKTAPQNDLKGDVKAKTEAAKKAGVSINGSSGTVSRSDAPAPSLREEIERQYSKFGAV